MKIQYIGTTMNYTQKNKNVDSAQYIRQTNTKITIKREDNYGNYCL